MKHVLDTMFARFWNNLISRRKRSLHERGLGVGYKASDGEVSRFAITIPHGRRAEHIAILGKTGTGKSSLLRYFCEQDIATGRGFIFFDLHGEATPIILSMVAAREEAETKDFSDRLVVVDPADPEFSVGLNPLEGHRGNNTFVRILEFAEILKQRWHLDTFGARTDELLRNALYVLAENGLTLLELIPLLTGDSFRSLCLKNIANQDVRQYFETRYDQASTAMQAVMREPILNKTSAFTADPHFRHIVGQLTSTFSLLAAMEEGKWVVLNLHKGRLGEEAATLGSLFLTGIKNALFSRTKRRLFTLYADEIQNLVAFGSDVETMLSEARKFGVSVCSANQYLDQYPAEMRAAILAVGTHIFFRLSSADAQQIASALDGGKLLAETLKNLPPRQLVLRVGDERWQEVAVPSLTQPKHSILDLYERSRRRWARKRTEVDEEIAKRLAKAHETRNEVLRDWE